MITQETIDLIYRTAQLADVVGDHVEMHKQGTDWRGPCPFHKGKKPNFSYSPSKGVCHCFKCQESANNAVEFIMKVQGISWREALHVVAKRYAIEIVEKALTPEAQAAKARKEAHRAVYKEVQTWYEAQLWGSEGEDIRTYLQARGIDEEVARLFGLGYSTMPNTQLGQCMMDKGYTAEQLQALHVVYMDRNHDLRDKYAGRLLFALHDEYGRCIGFSGRAMGAAQEGVPKYVNSRESEGYQKRYTLYGYHIARSHMVRAQRVFLVEGLMDVLAMHQCGLPQTVGSQGTAVTAEHIALIKRSCAQVTVILDSDDAGQMATQRVLGPLLQAGCSCQVVTLPEGEDPASYALRYGREALRKIAQEGAVDFIQYLWEPVAHLEDMDRRVACCKTIIDLIARVPDGVYRHEYTVRAAKWTGIDEAQLAEEVLGRHREMTKAVPSQRVATSPRATTSMPTRAVPQGVSIEEIIQEHESILVQDMVLHGEVVGRYLEEVRSREHWIFTDERMEALYRHMQLGGVPTAHPDKAIAQLAQGMLDRHRQVMKVVPQQVREQLQRPLEASVQEHIRLYKAALERKKMLDKHQEGIKQLTAHLGD